MLDQQGGEGDGEHPGQAQAATVEIERMCFRRGRCLTGKVEEEAADATAVAKIGGGEEREM